MSDQKTSDKKYVKSKGLRHKVDEMLCVFRTMEDLHEHFGTIVEEPRVATHEIGNDFLKGSFRLMRFGFQQ